ncbi:MAG: nitric oxide reductase [Acidobacteria bacterium]|nr:MAG: nitric oxide reductase [Acidobacteriota bacterium]
MDQSWLDKLMSKKGLYTVFWVTAIVMVVALIGFTTLLVKEVPPIPQKVIASNGSTLYTYDDVVAGKGYFQEFDLMDYGTMLGMGAYLGPDFTEETMHRRIVSLYDAYSNEEFGVSAANLTDIQRGKIKEMVKADLDKTKLSKGTVVYSHESSAAYYDTVEYWINFLVNGNKKLAWPGGVIKPEEARKIAVFFDWGQLVASTKREGTNRTWSNNWPSEPLIDQNVGWSSLFWSLMEVLLLWTLTILIVYLMYEYFVKKEKDEVLEQPLVLNSLFPSQKKLFKYLPVVALFFLLQVILGGYIAHIYTEPAKNFILSQSILPFNVIRALHVNIAIVWVTVGWLVGGMFIAPLVAKKDLRFPWLVDVLWLALVVVAAGGIFGIYAGATGYLRDTWFWLGNEGREYLNLGRVWDIGLVVGLVLWFLMVFSTIRKAKENNVMVGTIIWSAFGIATLYMAGMAPVHKIIPNFTVDDYYRWWVVHLWVELTFELFAAGVLAYLAVLLGLVPRKTAEKVMLFELVLIMVSGILGVGHHYWWQGLDEYWVAIGGAFSAMEPVPLVILMIEAWKQYKDIKLKGKEFAFTVPFMWLTGSAFLNWYGAGFLGMIANLPIVNYYSHGTYLIMPHGHVALLGAFGYISIAFIYIVARSKAATEGRVWNDKYSKIGFWLVTGGIVLFSLPTLIIGFHQTEIAYKLGYHAARARETVEAVKGWMWFRILPDSMIIFGAATIFVDIVKKTFLSKKA